MTSLSDKPCRICGEVKPLSDFYKDSRYEGGYKHLCKACQNDTRNRRREERRKWIQGLKMEIGCADCGFNSHPEALHFDHLPGFDKVIDIARLADSAQAKYKEEIGKCEVVCANCHAIRTHNRRLNKI
tara:strand:- start:1831 stop:2214 length:384 start_codon:yes stop_codon:yes gene_type:complete